MQGKILDYNSEFKSGLIRGEDGNKYRFSIDDCKSAIKPRTNAEVDFESSEDKAVEVYVLTKDTLDDVKDVASAAVDTTKIALQTSTSAFKKMIPIVIILVLIGGIAIFYSEVVKPHQEKQALLKKADELQELLNKTEVMYMDKNYSEALSAYEAIYESARQAYLEDFYGFDFSRYMLISKFKEVECLIELKNSIRAKAVLDSIIENFSSIDESNLDEKDKAKYFILRAKINALNNKYKSSLSGHFSFMDDDYYSSNAKKACEYGDCSLVEK